MSYHSEMSKLQPLVVATKMTPEQMNIMVKFAKVARRSARQNTVLHTMIEEVIDPKTMKLQVIDEEGANGKTWQSWRVVPI